MERYKYFKIIDDGEDGKTVPTYHATNGIDRGDYVAAEVLIFASQVVNGRVTKDMAGKYARRLVRAMLGDKMDIYLYRQIYDLVEPICADTSLIGHGLSYDDAMDKYMPRFDALGDDLGQIWLDRGCKVCLLE